MEIKKEMEKNDKVASVSYISREQALSDFKKNNANEPVIIQSLEEIGENPLLSSIIVTAKNPSDYESIAQDISEASFKEDVSRINYSRVKEYIEKLNSNMADLRKVWIFLAGIFAAISVLIIFNTIRITIYTHRQEIEVMRLVGASNTFIRLPFIFEGLIYGLIASVVSMGLLFAFVKVITLRSALLVTPNDYSIIYSQDVLGLYFSNIILLFFSQIFFATLIGIFSSLVAMRKYLKV
jgi:cell division transport system permease protein